MIRIVQRLLASVFDAPTDPCPGADPRFEDCGDAIVIRYDPSVTDYSGIILDGLALAYEQQKGVAFVSGKIYPVQSEITVSRTTESEGGSTRNTTPMFIDGNGATLRATGTTDPGWILKLVNPKALADEYGITGWAFRLLNLILDSNYLSRSALIIDGGQQLLVAGVTTMRSLASGTEVIGQSGTGVAGVYYCRFADMLSRYDQVGLYVHTSGSATRAVNANTFINVSIRFCGGNGVVFESVATNMWVGGAVEKVWGSAFLLQDCQNTVLETYIENYGYASEELLADISDNGPSTAPRADSLAATASLTAGSRNADANGLTITDGSSNLTFVGRLADESQDNAGTPIGGDARNENHSIVSSKLNAGSPVDTWWSQQVVYPTNSYGQFQFRTVAPNPANGNGAVWTVRSFGQDWQTAELTGGLAVVQKQTSGGTADQLALFVNDTGYVGVGAGTQTTPKAPQSPLHVFGAIQTSSALILNPTGVPEVDSNQAALWLESDNGSLKLLAKLGLSDPVQLAP